LIEAHKGGAATWAVEAYLRQKLRGAFRGVWLRGVLPPAGRGLVLYANHTSWWDGFVLHALGQAKGWDAYCLMEEKNLARYRFLTRIGAFSVHPGKVASSLEALRYAKGLLKQRHAAVFLFPEGEIRPFGERPLRLHGGVEVLARAASADCLAVGIRYAFFEHEKPDVLLEVGAVHRPAPLEEFRAQLEQRVTSLLAVRRLDGFQQLLAGRTGVAQRWDGVRGLLRGVKR
jgi:1-acyl-sn-glycerol-3-phosphate acyltransferase